MVDWPPRSVNDGIGVTWAVDWQFDAPLYVKSNQAYCVDGFVPTSYRPTIVSPPSPYPRWGQTVWLLVTRGVTGWIYINWTVGAKKEEQARTPQGKQIEPTDSRQQREGRHSRRKKQTRRWMQGSRLDLWKSKTTRSTETIREARMRSWQAEWPTAGYELQVVDWTLVCTDCVVDPRSGRVNAQDQVKDSTFSQKGRSWVKDIFKLLLFTAHSCMYSYVMLCDLPDRHFLIKLVKF